MNNSEVLVDFSEASVQTASKKFYAAPTGPEDLSLRSTAAAATAYNDAGTVPDTAAS